MGWNNVGGNSQIQSEGTVAFDKPGQSFEGYFLGTNKFRGNYGDSTAHIFLDDDGKNVCIYGTKVLDDAMAEVQPGGRTKVLYKGKKKTKNGNTAKIWEVKWNDEDLLDEETLTAALAIKSSAQDDDEVEEEDEVEADAVPAAKEKRPPQPVTKSSTDKMNNLLKNRKAAQ